MVLLGAVSEYPLKTNRTCVELFSNKTKVYDSSFAFISQHCVLQNRAHLCQVRKLSTTWNDIRLVEKKNNKRMQFAWYANFVVNKRLSITTEMRVNLYMSDLGNINSWVNSKIVWKPCKNKKIMLLRILFIENFHFFMAPFGDPYCGWAKHKIIVRNILIAFWHFFRDKKVNVCSSCYALDQF